MNMNRKSDLGHQFVLYLQSIPLFGGEVSNMACCLCDTSRVGMVMVLHFVCLFVCLWWKVVQPAGANAFPWRKLK